MVIYWEAARSGNQESKGGPLFYNPAPLKERLRLLKKWQRVCRRIRAHPESQDEIFRKNFIDRIVNALKVRRQRIGRVLKKGPGHKPCRDTRVTLFVERGKVLSPLGQAYIDYTRAQLLARHEIRKDPSIVSVYDKGNKLITVYAFVEHLRTPRESDNWQRGFPMDRQLWQVGNSESNQA